MRFIKLLILSLLLIIIKASFAQKKPYPQKGKFKYQGGFQTNVITNEELLGLYTNWKNKYTEFCSSTGGIRVLSDQWSGSKRFTVSEGQAYGMLMAAYFGEKDFFDKILKVYNYPAFQTRNNLMHWRVLCTEVDGTWCATDADQDAALALLVAYDQWGEQRYKDRAVEVIKALREHTLYPINYDNEIKWQMRIGDNDSNPPSNAGIITDYYVPAYYRLFAETEGNQKIWDEHRISGQAYLKRNVDLLGPNTGINSKIAYPDGRATPGQCGKTGQWGNPCTYNWDASRTPWRQALDYAWYGDLGESSKNYCVKLTDWVDNVLGVNNINSAGYWPDGTEEYPGTGPKIAFVGGFACGAMCHSQDRLDRFAAKAKKTNEQSYYGNSLRILYYLLITGNMWKPGNPVISSNSSFSGFNGRNVKLFPNPISKGKSFTIQIYGDNITTANIIITDLQGKTVFNNKKQLTPGNLTFCIESEKFLTGFYFISIVTNRFSETGKILITA